MMPKHSRRAGKSLSMDMWGAAAEAPTVLCDMFFPWISTNLLAASIVMVIWGLVETIRTSREKQLFKSITSREGQGESRQIYSLM